MAGKRMSVHVAFKRGSAVPTPGMAPVGRCFLHLCHDPKLMGQLHELFRCRHYSRRKEQTYSCWIKRFIYLHKVRPAAEMAGPEVKGFVAHLALKEKVSASTLSQALSALVFLYRRVIGREVGDLGGVTRTRKPRCLPVVMTREGEGRPGEPDRL